MSQSSRQISDSSLDPTLQKTGRIGSGLCFVLFPLVWIFAFWAHPNLLKPKLFLQGEDLIRRAHGSSLLQFGHALVTLNTALMIPITFHYMHLLGRSSGSQTQWLGYLGAIFAVFGACMLAADKSALYLTMSALNSLSPQEFEQLMPGLIAIFSFDGWMFLLWGMILMGVGVLLQIWGMMRAETLPQWQLRLLFVGVLFIGFPDGAEIINLVAAILMAVAMIPYGIKLMTTSGDDGKKSD